MFEVRCYSPFDDEWKERDDAIRRAAGRVSDWAGAGFGARDHGWTVETLAEATVLKAALEAVPLVNVTIREGTTH